MRYAAVHRDRRAVYLANIAIVDMPIGAAARAGRACGNGVMDE